MKNDGENGCSSMLAEESSVLLAQGIADLAKNITSANCNTA